MSGDGSFSVFAGGKGQSGFILASFEEILYLRFHDQNNKLRARFGLDATGAPSLEFFDKDEKRTLKLTEN